MQNKWEQDSGKLVKNFRFQNFKEALKFINNVGEIAESINHHPKIINIYNTVRLELWTHSQNTISDLDFQLADKIDQQTNEG
jgi:4a-hydroxytetrahydrobiopterin dehydratase